MDTSYLPFTAWEQAVFVVLFIVFVIYLLTWFSKQQNNWQNFITKRDDEWRDWLDKSSCHNTEALKKVADALDALIRDLDNHDRKVEDRFDQAIQLVSNGHGSVISDRRKKDDHA